jgi:hypothetical protein
MQDAITTAPPAYKDRHSGLVAFGTLELLLALGSSLMVFAAVVTAIFADLPSVAPLDAETPPAGIVAIVALPFLATAIVFGWLGVGSILARRWARTLSLSIGWLWLVVVAIDEIVLLAVLRVPPPARDGFVLVVGPAYLPMLSMLAGVGAWGLIFLLPPLALVLFYGGENVRATCEARDPKPRWTDRCPVPVLLVALVASVIAAGCVVASLRPTVSVFGHVATGAPAAAALLVFALLAAAIARGLYELRPAAWWACLLLLLSVWASAAIGSAHRADWTGAVLVAAFLGYLLWIRRFLIRRPA